MDKLLYVFVAIVWTSLSLLGYHYTINTVSQEPIETLSASQFFDNLDMQTYNITNATSIETDCITVGNTAVCSFTQVNGSSSASGDSINDTITSASVGFSNSNNGSVVVYLGR